MSRLGKTWCDVCQKGTHDTKDCWGLGTVSVPPVRDPMASLSIGDILPPTSFSRAVLAEALHAAVVVPK